MKSTIRLSLALLCLIFSSSPGICQSVLEETFQIKDAEGKNYTLEELRVSNGLASLNTEDNCSDNSYFNLFFEQGSGFEDYANNPVHAERAEVLCQVFSDLSTFIQPIGDEPQINILVREFQGDGSSYAGATAFYFVPVASEDNSPDFIEGTVWHSINSTQDPYNSIAYPLINGFNSNSDGGFYHGILQFNFNSQPFSTNLAATPSEIPSSSRDLYSVALHEALHLLDFRSLIDEGGISALGENQPYFSRFDSKLKAPDGTPFFTGSDCDIELNPDLSSLVWPDPCSSCMSNSIIDCYHQIDCGGDDPDVCSIEYCLTLDCNNSVLYDGILGDYPITTNSCFILGTSLSHISEPCFSDYINPDDVPCAIDDDPEYEVASPWPFVMYTGNGQGEDSYRRVITPEERSILCDLGYQTLSTWVAPGNSNQNIITYDFCAGTAVSGVYDGIVDGNYIYVAEVGEPFELCPFNDGLGFLDNDYNAQNSSCWSVISGFGSLAGTSNCEDGEIYTPFEEGFHVLGYKPLGNGAFGNLTFVIIYVPFSECIDQCSIIPNGEFEQFIYANPSDPCVGCNEEQNNSNQIGDCGQRPVCWDQFGGTPDFFRRGCDQGTKLIPISTLFTSNINEVWNYDPFDDEWVNDHFIALRGISEGVNGTFMYEEAMIVDLTTPLQPGVDYSLSLVAKEIDQGTYTSSPQELLILLGDQGMVNQAGSYDPFDNIDGVNPNDYSGPSWIIETNGWVNEPNGSQWVVYTLTIPGEEITTPYDALVIANNGSGYIDQVQNEPIGMRSAMIMIDNVQLTTAVPTPDVPDCILSDQTLDLNDYNQNGSYFTLDDGVTTIESVELGGTGFPLPGEYTIIYNYPYNGGNCIANSTIDLTIYEESISDLEITVTGNQAESDGTVYICPGTTITLSSNTSNDITWSPQIGLDDPNAVEIEVTPESNITYALEYTGEGCPQFITLPVIVETLSITADPPAVCDGNPIALEVIGGDQTYLDYEWQDLTNNLVLDEQSTYIIGVNPSENTVYEVTGITEFASCIDSDQIEVTVSTSTPIQYSSETVCGAVDESFQINADTPLINEYSWEVISPNVELISGMNDAIVTLQLESGFPSAVEAIVTGTNNDGCVSTQNISISVTPVPNPEISANPGTLCNSNDDVTFTYTSEPNGSRLWTAQDFDNSNEQSFSISPNEDVTVNLEVTANGCTGSDTYDFEVLNYSVSITDENASICLGESIDLEAVIDGGEDVDYSIEWTFNGDVIEDENETSLTYTPLAEGTFVVSVIPDQCIDIGQPAQAVTIFDNFNPDPVIEFIDVEHYCAGNGGEATVQVTEDGVIVEAVIEWDGLGNSATQTDLSPGTYTVNVTGTQGCTASASIEIIDEECCPGQAGLQLFMNNGEILCSDLLASNFNLDDGSWLVPGNLVVDVDYYVTGAQLYFVSGSEITIEEGFTLGMNNCVLSTCDNSWDGIKAIGDQANAMTLDLKNCVVEYATIGIESEDTMVQGLNSENWNGALLLADQTTFIDCERALEIRYCNYFNADLNDQDPNASFTQCHFVATPEYDNRFAFDQNWSLVKYDHVRGYSFEECIFENNRNQSVWEERGVAIFAVDARFNVVGDFLIQDVNGVESKIPNPLTTEFSGFMEGIYDAITLDSFNHMNVYYNNFAQNQRCIYTEGMCWQDIILNEFELGEILPQVGDQAVNIEGYVAVGGSFFRVEENEIVNAGNNTLATTIGIRIVDTNSPNDQLYANDISSCDYGVLYSGDNNTNDLDFLDPPGFRTVCHTFNNNVADIFVSNEGVVDENQWSFGVPANDDEITLDFMEDDEAGNTFSDDGVIDNFNHFQDGGQEINYHTYDDDLPFDFSQGITTIESFVLQSDCNSNDHVFLWDEETAFDEVHLGNWVDNSVNLNGGAEEVKFLIKSLIDDGDTPELQSELELAWSNDTWIMRDKLLAISPYVSRDVLYDVADDVVLFPHSVALEIFIANPDVMRDLRFLHHLETKANPMPAYMIELLYAARDEETSRSILNRELARLTAIERTVNQVALHYVGEMKEINWTQVQALHDLNKDYTDDMRAAEWMLAGNIPGNWTSTFAELEGNPGIRGNDNEEVTSMHEFLTILEPYLSSANSIMAMSSSDLSSLEQLALNKERLSGSRARSVLNAYYGFNLRVPAIIDAPELFFFQTSSTSDVLDRNQVKVYPSPASTRITIDWSKIESSSEEFTLEILDQTGRIVYSETLTGIREQSSIDCTLWSSSSYIYKLYSRESEYVGRFEIIH